MIGIILPLIARLGVAQRFQRVVAWLALLAGVIALLGLVWAIHASIVGDAVERDRERGEAAAVGQARTADHVAGAAKDRRDDAFANEQQDLERKVDDAADRGDSPIDVLFDELRD